MPLSEIANFKALAEELSFTRAAESLFISQSALSKSIDKLESQLGFPLFVRNTRKVELTAAGRSFYKDMVSLLDYYRQSIERAKARSTASFGTVHVGGHFANPRIRMALESMRVKLVSQDIPFEIEADPKHLASIERQTGLNDPYDDALSMTNDVSLIYCDRRMEESGLEVVPLFEERVFAFIPYSAKFRDRESISLYDLKDMNLVTTSTYAAFQRGLLERCRGVGLILKTRLHVVDSLGDLLTQHSLNEYVLLPESMLQLVPEAVRQIYLILRCSDEFATVQVAAVYSDKKNTAVAQCVEALREAVGD